MATSFIRQATSKLAPAYAQQTNALQSQIPAVQQMYESLSQALQGKEATNNQNILEGANSRGILNSTMPVYDQAVNSQSILQEQGQLGAKQMQEIGGINQQIAGVGVDKANAIAQLANQMWTQSNQKQQFNFTKQQAAKDYSLQKRLGDQQYQMALQKARL